MNLDCVTDSVVSEIDIFTSATGNLSFTLAHVKKMKNNAIIGDIGHFDNEIDMAGSEGVPCIEVENIKPQVIVSVPRRTWRHRACLCQVAEFGRRHRFRRERDRHLHFCHGQLESSPWRT